MFYKEPAQFISEGLPALINGTSRLNVLFATYREVPGYDGDINTGKNGLTVKVQSGHLRYSPIVLSALMSGHLGLGKLGLDLFHQEGREAQIELESSIEVGNQEGATFLAVIYAGLSAFGEAVEMARKIKMDNPTAKIVITACDCDRQRKEVFLNPLVEAAEITAVVTTWECGGRQAMRDILEGIVRAWPTN